MSTSLWKEPPATVVAIKSGGTGSVDLKGVGTEKINVTSTPTASASAVTDTKPIGTCSAESLLPPDHVVVKQQDLSQGTGKLILFLLFKKDDVEKKTNFAAIVKQQSSGIDEPTADDFKQIKRYQTQLIKQFQRGIAAHLKAHELGVAVPLYGFKYCTIDTDAKFPVMTMTLMKRMKQTVHDFLEKDNQLSDVQQQRLIYLAESLSKHHILHNDFGTANVMMDDAGELYLIDFETSLQNDKARQRLAKWYSRSNAMIRGKPTVEWLAETWTGKDDHDRFFLPYQSLDLLSDGAPDVADNIASDIRRALNTDPTDVIFIFDFMTLLRQIEPNPYDYPLLITALMDRIKTVSPMWYAAIQVLLIPNLGTLNPLRPHK